MTTTTDLASAERLLQRGFFPPDAHVTLIDSLAEANEILRSQGFRAAFGTNSPWVNVDAGGDVRIVGLGIEPDTGAGTAERWTDFFDSKEVHFMHGPDHAQRRKAMAPLLARNAHLWYRDRVLVPSFESLLGTVLRTPGPDGRPRTDLVEFLRHLFGQIAAKLIGLEGVGIGSGTSELLAIVARLERSLSVVHDRVPVSTEEFEAVLQDALDARSLLDVEFYQPALKARRALLARHAAGEIDDADLPHDLIGLIAQGHASFADPEAGLEQAVAFLTTIASAPPSEILHTFAALSTWFAVHPDQRERWRDDGFLEHAVSETIRLHLVGMIPRVATEDLTLPSGRQVSKGQYFAILHDVINRDPAIFGPDAGSYDPTRDVPTGTAAYGLGFGSGPHMCMGLPLMMGQGGISGTLAPVLRWLLESGCRPDPDQTPEKLAQAWPFRDLYETFPVIFDAPRPTSELG